MALWWCCILAAAIAGPCEPAVMPAQVMLRFYWQRLRQLPLLKDRDHGCPRETLAGTWFAWICQSSWGSKKTETRLDTIWHRAKTPKIGASSSTPQRNGGSTFNIPKKMESSIELLQPPAAVDWLWIGIPCRLSEGPWGWPVMSSHIIPEKCLSEKKEGKKKINLWSITVSPNKTILKQPFWGVPYKISPIATLMGCVNSPRHPRPGQAVRLPWDNTVVTRGHIEHPMFAKKTIRPRAQKFRIHWCSRSQKPFSKMDSYDIDGGELSAKAAGFLFQNGGLKFFATGFMWIQIAEPGLQASFIHQSCGVCKKMVSLGRLCWVGGFQICHEPYSLDQLN